VGGSVGGFVNTVIGSSNEISVVDDVIEDSDELKSAVGPSDAASTAATVGVDVGSFVGSGVGSSVGGSVATLVGAPVGICVGNPVGTCVGAFVGDFVGFGVVPRTWQHASSMTARSVSQKPLEAPEDNPDWRRSLRPPQLTLSFPLRLIMGSFTNSSSSRVQKSQLPVGPSVGSGVAGTITRTGGFVGSSVAGTGVRMEAGTGTFVGGAVRETLLPLPLSLPLSFPVPSSGRQQAVSMAARSSSQ